MSKASKAFFLIVQIICVSLFWLQDTSAKSVPDRRPKLSEQEVKEVFWPNPKVYPGRRELTRRIQKYLEERWTYSRLMEFSERPEIRAFRGWVYKGHGGDEIAEGQLFKEKEDQIGEIKWMAWMKNGVPKRFWIERNNPYLAIDDRSFYDRDFTEDDFKIYVLSTVLNFALCKKNEPNGLTEFERSCSVNERYCRIEWNELNKPVFLIGKLNNESKIRVGLNDKWQIRSIEATGKSAPVWDSVFNSIQKVYEKQEEIP